LIENYGIYLYTLIYLIYFSTVTAKISRQTIFNISLPDHTAIKADLKNILDQAIPKHKRYSNSSLIIQIQLLAVLNIIHTGQGQATTKKSRQETQRMSLFKRELDLNHSKTPPELKKKIKSVVFCVK
jgi:transposase InsO family protein